MAHETAPLTKLQAVNAILFDIGDRPVNTLTGSTRLDVIRAIESLEHVTRALLIGSWWFNREKVIVTLDGDDKYPIGDDFADVEVYANPPAAGTLGPSVLVVRGRFLYDLQNGRDTFAGEGPITLTIARLLEYEQLPNTAREYVYAAASVRNQSRSIGSSAVDADLRQQAATAFAVMHGENIDFQNIDQTFSPSMIDMFHRR